MGSILFAEREGVHVLKFVGDVRLSLGPTITSFLSRLETCQQFNGMIVDLSETDTIDSTALGLIAKIAICTREKFNSATSIVSPREDITRVLKSMAMEHVCVVTKEVVNEHSDLSELPVEICSEETMRAQVLEAHRTLMGLDDENFDKFHELVEALESEENQSTTPTPKKVHTG